eukprot:1159807-Pelagomonas_calceolata.AAC.8
MSSLKQAEGYRRVPPKGSVKVDAGDHGNRPHHDGGHDEEEPVRHRPPGQCGSQSTSPPLRAIPYSNLATASCNLGDERIGLGLLRSRKLMREHARDGYGGQLLLQRLRAWQGAFCIEPALQAHAAGAQLFSRCTPLDS